MHNQTIFQIESFLHLQEQKAKSVLGYDLYKQILIALRDNPDKRFSYRWADSVVYLQLDGNDILKRKCRYALLEGSLYYLMLGLMELGEKGNTWERS